MRQLLSGVLLAALLLAGCSAAGHGEPPSTAAAAGSGAETPTQAPAPPAPTATAVQAPAATVAAPPAVAGRVRPAAFAGSWYPGRADQLRSTVDELLAASTAVDGAPLALIVPHAGYAYSGRIAAAGFRQLAQAAYDVAVIIAADHAEPVSRPIAVWPEGGFETPLGIVPVDSELAQALIAADPAITADEAAHQGEHMIEIELPFLQRVCPQCRIVPVLMGTADDAAVDALARGLARVLPGRRAVIVASSDLSHYPAYDDARAVDGATLAAIETGDPAAVRAAISAANARGVPGLATCACGEGPILATMKAAAALGADTVSLLAYANSGDTPGSDRGQVVGYAAVMLWRYEPPALARAQQETLLAAARAAIAAHLEAGAMPPAPDGDPVFARPAGAFVTLRKNGELRGCIGHILADQPLARVVQEMAVAAAASDPRFLPLTAEELPGIEIEISVLSPLRRITGTDGIEIGVHGLLVAQYGRQGLLLPQVPVQEGWDKAAFLENLCAKAGLMPGCWQEGALYSFTAIVFGE